MLKTRMTELLGIEHPVQCGSMQWLSRAELVAAVANAGGFACLVAATMGSPEALAEEILKTKDLTDRPFGVNVSLFPTLTAQDIAALIQVVIDHGVKIIETAGRNPEPYRPQIKDGGLIHVHKCARVRDAAKTSRMGLDAVAVVGTEAGGHPGMGGVTSMVLIPKAADAVDVPLIAGGGICDGRSLAAALALGADGVVMGTRFMNTRECLLHPEVKARLEKAAEMETVMVMESIQNPGRVLRNAWAEKVLGMEREGRPLEELAPLISGQNSLKALTQGVVEEGLIYCGQVVGRVEDTPSVAELMDRIVSEAAEVKTRLDGMYRS